MLKIASLPNIFGASRKPEHPGIASIKVKIRPLSRRARISVPLLWVSYGLMAVNAVVLMSYLFGVNQAASVGYEIKKIQQKIAIQQTENQALSLKISEQASIASIQSDYLNHGYVPIGQTSYLQVNSFTDNNSNTSSN